MPDPVAFCDIESTSLDRDLLQVWEVALIAPLPCEEDEEDQDAWEEYVWHLPVDLSRADPMSLSMNGFTERYNDWDTPAEDRAFKLWEFAREFALYTRGLTLVGANPAFDERALWKLLRDNGECPLWHYRPICVETLAAGWLAGRGGKPADDRGYGADFRPPWRSDALSMAVGVDADDYDRHTALGDARWAKAIYEAVMGQ